MKHLTTYQSALWGLLFVLCGAMTLILSGCHSSGGSDPVPPATADHTLLIYIIGDNSLSTYAASNIASASQGLLNATQPVNVVIYKDNESGLPVLFRLQLSDDKLSVTQDTLLTWDTDVNSADPEHVAYVVDYVFNQKFDTTVKGLEMWSHGDSWVPGGATYYILATVGAKGSPLTYIGIDGTSYLNIWDLSSALSSTGVHFNYILFDACFMATAEVAYELRSVTDYIGGSLCEIMGPGLPYSAFIPSLAVCQTETGVESALRVLVDDFEGVYGSTGQYKNNGGTFAVIRTSAMGDLLNAYRTLRDAHPAALDSLRRNAGELRFTLQRYGRYQSGVNRTALYHDMGALLRFIDSDNTGTRQLLAQAVVKEYHSEFFKAGNGNDSRFELTDVSGMAVTVPEFLYLYSDAASLAQAYRKCAWGKALNEN